MHRFVTVSGSGAWGVAWRGADGCPSRSRRPGCFPSRSAERPVQGAVGVGPARAPAERLIARPTRVGRRRWGLAQAADPIGLRVEDEQTVAALVAADERDVTARGSGQRSEGQEIIAVEGGGHKGATGLADVEDRAEHHPGAPLSLDANQVTAGGFAETQTMQVGIVHGLAQQLLAILCGEDQGVLADVLIVPRNLGTRNN